MNKLRFAIVLCISGIIWLGGLLVVPSAEALTPIKISDLSYEACSGEMSENNVSSGDLRPANCFMIRGKAKNISGKPVVDADVFGRIYDANGNTIAANRGRIGTIAEVPPGVSDFEIRISVPANQPTPLELKQFKASGFAGKVRPYYYDDFNTSR
jgi:hypothetical protein